MFTQKKFFSSIVLTIIFLSFGLGMIIYSKETSEAVSKSINICLSSIIPSLYGMMILSNILIKTNIYMYLAKPFSLISRYIFKMSPDLFSVFLISNLGGYPVGITMLKELLNSGKIEKKQAEKMISFCYAPNPGFMAVLIGVTLFHNTKMGIFVYLSCFISNLIIAFIIGFKQKIPSKEYAIGEISFTGEMLFTSIQESAHALFKICVTIVFFSIIISLADCIGIFDKIINSEYIKTFMEISNVSSFKFAPYYALGAISAISSFGGICILSQVMMLNDGSINLKYFFIFRIIAFFLSYVIIRIFNINISTSICANVPIFSQNNTILPSILLILMTFILLTKKI